MKTFLLLTLVFSSSVSFAKNGGEGDGGMSSSGGGEYIVSRNNPWFLGKETVKWCIDHGGADKFSLSKSSAKKEIEFAIDVLAKQLKSINSHSSIRYLNPVIKGYWKNGVQENNDSCDERSQSCIYLSDEFAYTDNCEEADVEFILGNTQNPLVQQRMKDLGIATFKDMVAEAVRTDYSTTTKRAKGFVYIAADKGDIQYAGSRNIFLKSETIWDLVEKLDPDAPNPFQASIFSQINVKNLSLKSISMGALAPVVAHEFGHILGMVHHHHQNIMNEDYPALVVKDGLVFKGNFKRDSMILSRGLIESDKSRRIGFDMSTGQLLGSLRGNEIRRDNPKIFSFLKDVPQVYEKNLIEKFFIFNHDASDEENNYLETAFFKKGKLEYQLYKRYKIVYDNSCYSGTAGESVNFRSEKVNVGASKYYFDSQTKQWAESKSESYKTVQTNVLLNLGETLWCGKIFLNDEETDYLSFKLTHDYYQENNVLELSDPGTLKSELIYLGETDIFQTVGEALPVPELPFTLE